MSKNMDLIDAEPRPSPTAKDKFPRVVIIIILAEFCERFSYSGMRAFLTLYLRSKLGYSDDGATETYHIFSTLVYLFPIIGGILADNYLGKFRTILYLMFVYAAGNILVAITAIPQLALPGRLCTLLGLFMITIGTGGIKPCVTAFGGDQFKFPEQEHHLAIYFSILYFNVGTGSLIAKTMSPILRSEVHCFGDKDCYSLAFGAPSIVVLISIVIFVSAKSRYVMKKPEGNIVLDFIKCISLGLKNVALRRNVNEKGGHWLDSTRVQYDQRFIRDIKKTLSVLKLFTVTPIFWALLDQMGSRWTLQATKLDGRFGFLTIKPDQMQVLNPIFVLTLIPITQKYIYPFLEKRNILKNPLHKLTLGGILAGLAFIVSGLVEIYISTKYPVLPKAGYAQLRLFNGNQCFISLHNDHHNITYTIPPLSHFSKKDIRVKGVENINFELAGSCIQPTEKILNLEENRANSFFLSGNHIHSFKDNVDKSKSGFPIIRFLVTDTVNTTGMIFVRDKTDMIEAELTRQVSSQIEVFSGLYSLRDGNEEIITSNITVESGGVYALVIDKNGSDYKSNLVVITEANSFTMAWLLPQFLIMSIAEVLFCVTGNEFAFKESPESMKAVMMAVWLLTEAVGNVIIIVITRLFVNYRQETQFFFYTGLIFGAMAVFYYLSQGYKHGHSAEEDGPKKECRSNSEVLYLQVKQTEDCLDH
ncbi:peptide transporter family 1-like [Galleria mellonella]|uniref:Peptide transporter family 1-like n=1 Tax=Galleria mellonella TaxID=7137 RepID=A0A6J3C8I2_GALME|nr:peptide transporter family 1-like [Galleria mellonella]